jgi:hypothetical protein
MKNTFVIMIFIAGIILSGCSNKQKDEAQLENKKQDSVKTIEKSTPVAKDQDVKTTMTESKKKIKSADANSSEKAEASLDIKIKEGKAFLISDGDSTPLKTEGDKVLAINMPDGKLYPVEMKGSKKIITVPGKGKMESKMIKGKMYLVDSDNKMYEVKVINKKLVAMFSDGIETKLVKK